MIGKSEGKKLFMDLLVIDVKHENAYVFGYDGELTMKIPDSAFKTIFEQVKDGKLKKPDSRYQREKW